MKDLNSPLSEALKTGLTAIMPSDASTPAITPASFGAA